MYIPDAQKWVKYYENMAKGYNNPFINQTGTKIKQIGGSLSGSQGQFMIPIEETSRLTDSLSQNPVRVQLVSPAQQVAEQAKSELQQMKRGVLRSHSFKSNSSAKRSRTDNTSLQGRKSQVKPKKKMLTKRKSKNVKKDFK